MDPVQISLQRGQFVRTSEMIRDEKLIKSSTNMLHKAFDEIKMFLSKRERLEERMRVVLNDYQQMINQMTLVSTLVVGFSVGHAGELLGNVDGQPEWKKTLHNTSTLIATVFGLMSVLEGVFYSVRLNVVEAKFLSGRYPLAVSYERAVPYLDINVVKDLNARYNAIFLFFSVSIFGFSVALMASMYVSQGYSTTTSGSDPTHPFELDWSASVAVYWSILTLFWVWSVTRFVGSWASNIHGKTLEIFFRDVCCCGNRPITDPDNIRRPLETLATRFKNNQIQLFCCLDNWEKKAYAVIQLLKRQRGQYSVSRNMWEAIGDEQNVTPRGWLEKAAAWVLSLVETGDPDSISVIQTGNDALAYEALESIRTQLRIVNHMKSQDQIDATEMATGYNQTSRERCRFFWSNLFFIVVGFPLQAIVTILVSPFYFIISWDSWSKIACACCIKCLRSNEILETLIENRRNAETTRVVSPPDPCRYEKIERKLYF